MIKDITNLKFGMLTVIKLLDKRTINRNTIWLCRCECGKFKEVDRGSLIAGLVKSCGCIHRYDDRQSVYDKVVISRIKESAIKRNIEFTIPDENVINLTKQNCFYCNKEPNNCTTYKADKIKLYYNGLDRVNSELGYSIENVVPCCKQCNMSKRTLSLEQFSNWIINVYNNFILMKTEKNI